MDAFWPIRLPYGLSHNHRHARTTGEVMTLPYGESPRLQVLSLQEISSGSFAIATSSSSLDAQHPASHPIRRAHKSFKKLPAAQMAYSRELRKINMGPATGKEKRGRKPKSKTKSSSKLSVSKSKASTSSTTQSFANSAESMKPSMRVGVSKDEPIMISDSEEDDAYEGSASTSRLPTAYSASSSSAQPLVRPSIEQSEKHQQSRETVKSKRKTHAKHSKSRVGSQVLTRKSVPGYIADNSQDGYKEQELDSQRAPYPSPTATVRAHHSERESSIFMGPSRAIKHDRPSSMQNARTSESSCRVKEHTPRSYGSRARKPSPQYSHFPTHSARSRKVQSLPSQSEVHNNAKKSDDGDDSDNVDMTLADIPDFDLRSKLAQLMAVAPSIPVRDLYNLLIDSKGVFPVAKERAIRASQPPQACRSARHPNPPSYEPTTPISPARGVDSDEEMVKIEPDDPAFEWDADAPDLELVEQQKQCMQKKSKARQKSTPRPSADQSKANTSKKRDKPSARSSKSNVRKPPPPDISGNKSNRVSAPSPRRRERSNSIDGDFVIPDDVSFVDADASYYDGSSEHGETNSSHSDIYMQDGD